MKKYFLVFLLCIAIIIPFFIFRSQKPSPAPLREKKIDESQIKVLKNTFLNDLKLRRDKLALLNIKKVLSIEPEDIDAMWAKAEVLRRNYKLKESESILNKILSVFPDHVPSLISLSYIMYHDYDFNKALGILKKVLGLPVSSREDTAMAYMLIGSVNAKRASGGGLLSKVIYGTRIKGYFEKAKAIAPGLSEVHLGLGSFYLLAPAIAGGNIDKAIEELEYAVKLTPEFATANARLAQAYRKKGNPDKYNFYIARVKQLDPENEVLREMNGKPISGSDIP